MEIKEKQFCIAKGFGHKGTAYWDDGIEMIFGPYSESEATAIYNQMEKYYLVEMFDLKNETNKPKGGD